jgi:hypothetical protein
MNILDNLTIVGIIFPLCFPPLVVASPPRMPPSLPWRHRLGRKKSCKTSLQHVRVSTDCMGSVAIVRTLAVEAEVASRGDEEGFEEISLS